MGQQTSLDPVVVGSIGAPHGVRGWVRINSFTEPGDNIFTYPLLLDTGKTGWQPIELEKFQAHGTGFVAKLLSIDDRDQAALITNAKLAVQRTDMPELDNGEYYWADIIGLTVSNEENIELGQVVDFFTTGANDVMVVRGADNKQHLIPYVPEMFILDVDLISKQIRVRWDAEF